MTSYIRGSDNADSANFGPSTDWGGTGSYALLSDANGTAQTVGNTLAGSVFDRAFSAYQTVYDTTVLAATPLSGTWRVMGYGANAQMGTLCLRIS